MTSNVHRCDEGRASWEMLITFKNNVKVKGYERDETDISPIQFLEYVLVIFWSRGTSDFLGFFIYPY